MRYRRKLGWVILFVIAFVGIVGLLTMYLWNWLMPYLFDLPEITFLQAAGILLLSKILFGFGGKGGWSKHKHKMHMNPAEKEMLRRRWMEKCGYDRHQASDVRGRDGAHDAPPEESEK